MWWQPGHRSAAGIPNDEEDAMKAAAAPVKRALEEVSKRGPCLTLGVNTERPVSYFGDKPPDLAGCKTA